MLVILLLHTHDVVSRVGRQGAAHGDHLVQPGAELAAHVHHTAAKHDLRMIDEGKMVANLLHRRHVVGGEHYGVALVTQRQDFLFQQFGVQRVETAERLVKMSRGGRWSTVMTNCTFCCMPLESSSSFLFHQGMMSNFSNQ